MESSPLIKAHDHAREASIATHTADTTVAVTEHALAAGEFASAAQTTSSIEALRTLKLLEQHHERLSQLLRYSMEHPLPAQQQQQQQQQRASDADSINEKDALAATTPSPTTAAGATTGTKGPAATTTFVSGVVSRGEFAATDPAADPAKAATAVSTTAAAAAAAAATSSEHSPAAASMSAAAAAHRAGAAAMANALQNTHSHHGRRYPPSRELSSSIASNLASARGIRSASNKQQRGQPAAPSMSSDQAPGSLSLDGHGGRQDNNNSPRAQMQSVLQQQQQQTSGAQPSWVPPKLPSLQQSAQQPQQQSQKPPMLLGTDDDDATQDSTAADEGFSRFYNRFGSIFNRLSAPLAFAGLPLITEESAERKPTAEAAHAGTSDHSRQAGQPNPRRTRSHIKTASMSSTTAADPELSKIYSKAALRAIGRDGLATGGSAADSFYVVPMTGHTASYANILSFDQKERRRLAASVHGGGAGGGHADDLYNGDGDDYDDDFADAKDARQRDTTSLPLSRRAGGGSSPSSRMHRTTGKGSQHVVEELYTENQGLKDMLDKLSKRLHAFEANAQHSHMALQESMRFMRPGSPGSSSGGRDTGGDRMRELEDELARALARLDASERERAHQEKTLQKYREKWEKLKAGAKARRDAQGGPAPLEAMSPK